MIEESEAKELIDDFIAWCVGVECPKCGYTMPGEDCVPGERRTHEFISKHRLTYKYQDKDCG